MKIELSMTISDEQQPNEATIFSPSAQLHVHTYKYSLCGILKL